uniref:NAD-dependent epimerase/dehydratase domain-containing protein n=1 Tax=Oryza rufipogon TaxID=4529 RepID=A0A0E0NMM9_ORYRU
MSSNFEANNNNGEKQLVCVTGAGGFIGSWVVKELLIRGYHVRGTARDPADSKNAHLLELEGADQRLSLCRADVLDAASLRAAFSGCHGVFHVASPVSNDPDLVPVAVEGTRNVINAAADMGVRRVVFTSSYGAVHMNPSRSPDAVLDETCWSDYEFCKQTDNLYCCAKMMAEMTATEEAAKRGLELAVVVPSMTMGPMLQQTLNFSSNHPMAKPYKFSNQRLKDLGLEFTPLRKSLHEAVLCMQQKSHLPLIYPVPKLSSTVPRCRSISDTTIKLFNMSCNSAEVAANDGSSNGGEKQQQQEEEVVCVTGAGGFIGSWVVKELLLRGYRVRGTARDPSKNAHLLALDGAGERLTLCRADVLDCESLRAAFAGCHGVFHVASPVSNDPNLVPIAVDGTRNVMNAGADMGVRRVVFTSSYGAVHMNPNRSPDTVLDETCWSDPKFCRQTDVYCYAKTMAEKAAEEEAAKRGVQLAVVLPCVTVGPILHPAINTSINHVVRYLTGAAPTYPNAVAAYVDVRDVARAHALVYERHDARGRYLCIGAVLHRAHLLQMLKELFPQYPVTSKCKDDGNPMVEPYKFSNQRLKDLGFEFTPMRKCLYDAVVCMQQKGHLPLVGTAVPDQNFRASTMSSNNSMEANNGDDEKKQEQVVCVTGAGGFIGSWVVKELLLRGYRVRGTARDPRKNAHLLDLEGAKERLTLCRADVLDFASLRAAFAGCHGVFHIASPVSKDPNLVPVAIEGTRNVMKAAADMGVRRVVFTSSYGAVHMNPNRSPDAVLDESCWSDPEFCQREDIYCYAKMMAEKTATEEASRRRLQLAVVVPCVTVGPILQPSVNFSCHHVVRYLTGAAATYPNAVAAYADVRDVARAHVLVYEHHGARGRYLCIGTVIHRAELLRMLKELFPQYPVTSKYMVKPYKFSNQRLRDLGLEFTPLRKSLHEAIECLQRKGHLPVVTLGITITITMSSISNDNNGDQKRQQQQQLVCVTGAGGFIGSWVVRELLLRGYRVRTTVRDPADRKNAHLLALEGAHERLSLRRADVLDFAGLLAAFAGCHGVFHVACPLSNRDPELMAVAVDGTRNVMNAAADMGVRRVVFTSSYGAVHMNPNRSPDAVLDESCWSDPEFCRQKDMYCYAKTMAEMAATEEAEKRGLELAVVVPSMTMGPMLQRALNLSSTHVANYLTGAKKSYPNAVAAYVDVRDVARAHALVYERHDARGRYLCIGAVLHRAQLLQMLMDLFPQYTIASKCDDKGKPMVKPYEFSNQRLKDLGLEFTPLRKSLYDAVMCMQRNGHLPVVLP